VTLEAAEPAPKDRPGSQAATKQLDGTSLGQLGRGLLAAALDLAAQGWAVFPCKWTGPHAKAPMTVNGHRNATTDPDKIKLWWDKWPRAMIGAPVPEPLLVIDVDPRNGGSLQELERLTGPLPETLIVWSGRNDGGQHLYFLRPPGRLTSTRLPEGLDLKVNGYCIVPPSIHPATGMPYRWEEHSIAAVPNGLLNLLKPKPAPAASAEAYQTPTKGALAGILRKVIQTQPSNRNKVLHWAACRLVEKNYPPAAYDALAEAARHTGLDDREISRTIASARGVLA
jgi:hypothetical protein